MWLLPCRGGRGALSIQPLLTSPASALPLQVFFHGCARAARAFWPFHPVYCPECLGALLRWAGLGGHEEGGRRMGWGGEEASSIKIASDAQQAAAAAAATTAVAAMHLPTHVPPGRATAAGFPEHVSHTKQALAAGYNVIVMDPTGPRCGGRGHRAATQPRRAARLVTPDDAAAAAAAPLTCCPAILPL